MDSLQRLLANFRDLWAGWTLPQQVTMVTAILVSALTIIGVGLWSTRAEMVPLASRLSPAQAAEVISQLEAANIPYQLSYSGSAIHVDRSELNRARLAARDTLGASPADAELEDSIWSDPNLQHARLLQQQEHRLAATVGRFRAIREAIVHISKPQPSPFLRDQTDTTASVIVDLVPGIPFSHQDATAVISLVSHSVEGLRAENVTLMDTAGRLLDGQQSLRADVGGQLEYVRTLESHLAAKAEALLSRMLGEGRAVVRVTADVDFTESERMETSYDPENKVKRSETIKSESHTGPSRGTTGAAGTPSNIRPAGNPAGSAAGSDLVSSKIEENTTEFANTEIRDTVKETPGRIKRLTVAAIVDLTPADAGTESAVTTEDVESLIKQAVGFDTGRQDEINVVASTLAGHVDLDVPAAPPWETYGPLVRQLSLGLGAVLMFVLGLRILRRLRPIVVSADGGEESADAIRQLAELTIRARENPALVAKVLENWLEDEPPASSSSDRAAVPAPRRRAA